MKTGYQNNIDIVFVIHNHQPVGNFDFVIEQAYRDSYEPFLSALEKHPLIKVALHYTGYLWEYISEKHPGFIQRLRVLVDREQVELLGGGYYEPILPVLPDKDADIQLSLYKAEMEKYSRSDVSGMWLAERVWEPGMPSIIARNGYRYTFLDESHFSAAGVPSGDIWGYFTSEDRGAEVGIFPIDQTLRYCIPFKPFEESLDELERRRGDGVGLITYGDDGEKFGSWPGTKKWVYEEGWLENFFTKMEALESVRMLLPREAVAEHSPRRTVYLPCASYEEMGKWTLPAETQIELIQLKKELEAVKLNERTVPFIRGGFWRQFLSKYPEVGRLYRRMLRVSEKLDGLEKKMRPEAAKTRRALMQGQANDAYWHGVFGGIYLPHLRFAVTKQLIVAENICDKAGENRIKFDRFEPSAVTLENPKLRVQVLPQLAGGISAIDMRSVGINLADTMTRQREAYHSLLLENASRNGNSHRSIHERVEVKEESLADKLVVDDHQRLCFIDRFLKPGVELEGLERGGNIEMGSFIEACFEVISQDKLRVLLQKTGFIKEEKLTLKKSYSMSAEDMKLEVEYDLKYDFNCIRDALFAPEIHINLLAPDADDRFFLLDGEKFRSNNLGSRGVSSGKDVLSLVDEYLGLRVNLRAVPQPKWMWYPVETVSLSESGIERIYQGSAIHPVWRLGSLEKLKPSIILTVEC